MVAGRRLARLESSSKEGLEDFTEKGDGYSPTYCFCGSVFLGGTSIGIQRLIAKSVGVALVSTAPSCSSRVNRETHAGFNVLAAVLA